MSSHALDTWQQIQLPALEEIEAAHAAVEGAGRGGPVGNKKTNRASVLFAAGQFQAFSRTLHSEAAYHLASTIKAPGIRAAVLATLTQSRELDRGNANAGNIGNDFARLGMDFWPAIRQLDRRNSGRQKRLDQLVIWRNSIAHQSAMTAENQRKVDGTHATLRWVRIWRQACEELAVQFDRCVGSHLATLLGVSAW